MADKHSVDFKIIVCSPQSCFQGCISLWKSACCCNWGLRQIMVSSQFWTAPTSQLYLPLELTPPTVAQSISHPGDASLWTLKRSELSGCWQMHGYYICNKCFVNKLTTLSLFQKSFINNNMVSKIRCIYWFSYKIVIGSQRTTSKC